ncbi:hypothetical protein NQ837_000888 [Providencia rettgeri]|nr:hypothetical protein [Providencia rettgeri]
MKKIKQQYRNAIIEGTWCWYPSLRNNCHKSFSTKQEKSTYAMHCIEYKGSMLKLRAARGFCLVDSRYDLPTSAYKLGKSWKHNSRRKNQYYRE